MATKSKKNNENKNDQEPIENIEKDISASEAAGQTDPNIEAEKEQEEAEVVVGFTLEEVDAMQKELEEAKAQASDFQDRWQRAMADFSNLKRRTEREQSQMKEKAIGDVVTPFLDVLDDLKIAIQNRPKEGEEAAWVEGIALIQRKLQNKLEVQGINTMEVEGEFFDPNFHEAISQEPSENHESGQIIGVVKPGYMIGNRVIRPAMVRVAA